GGGLGLMVQTLIVVVQNASSQAVVGAVTASAELSRWTGALVGVALMGAIVTTQVPHATTGVDPLALGRGLHAAFLAGVGLAGLDFAAVLRLPDLRLRERFEEEVPASPATPMEVL